MELNFDKEMDALLRRAARSGEIASSNAQNHLDADEISAFAENALPEKTRAVYVKHFAECDRCRTILSNTILLNRETASTVSAEPETIKPKVPWYRKIFAVPNLAYAMGALVLLFGGFLGILVYQSSNSSQNAEISRISDNEPKMTPNASGGETFYNSNLMSSNTADTSTNFSANTSITMSNAAATNTNTAVSTATTNTTTLAATPEVLAREKRDDRMQTDEKNKTAAARSNIPEKKPENDSAADQTLAEENSAAKIAPAKPVQPAPTAPVAGVSELQNNARAKKLSKEESENKSSSEPAREIGGKSFNRRDGVWYDANYRGQSTINIRRNTEAYRKLDKGLRIVAESLEGTVVVVWKEKAYRIQ